MFRVAVVLVLLAAVGTGVAAALSGGTHGPQAVRAERYSDAAGWSRVYPLAALLAEDAARQSLTPDGLAARVLAEHIPTRRRLGFVAIGESKPGRAAQEAEEMLAERFGR